MRQGWVYKTAPLTHLVAELAVGFFTKQILEIFSRLLKFLFASPTEVFQHDNSRLSDCFLSDFSAGSRIIHPVSGHQTD
jgi:hypothetical protein